MMMAMVHKRRFSLHGDDGWAACAIKLPRRQSDGTASDDRELLFCIKPVSRLVAVGYCK
jgi:hypothetical protein